TANGASVICEAAKTDNATSMTTNIITTMLYILGILAVIMIIFGGIRYVLSAGDASKIKTAKDTIMYSVIGLIVAVLAYAIVNFVVTRI
ncbi:MAG: pilin, partial [Candidatus Saccharibacteria bacterium]|nr:pilin [Candidatus Saccharibacteria bacterium]